MTTVYHKRLTTSDIKDILAQKLKSGDIRENGTIEIQNAQFVCDKSYIVEGTSCDIDMAWYEQNYHPLIEKGDQLTAVVSKLVDDPCSRQAVICLASPTDHLNESPGYICTIYVQMFLNGNKLKYIVNMRSNDVARFPVDYEWHEAIYSTVAQALADRLGTTITCQHIEWNVGSLHIYEKDFHLLSNID